MVAARGRRPTKTQAKAVVKKTKPKARARVSSSKTKNKSKGKRMSDIAQRVKEIVCEQMGTSPEKVTESTSFVNDLGADSLDTVELVMEFEEQFDINIPDEDAEKIQTVGDAVTYITKNAKK
jgi:acyl carrier protein